MMKNYTGHKAIPGLIHQIINHIPQHSIMLEPFCGSAVVSEMTERDRGARSLTVINDCDAGVTSYHSKKRAGDIVQSEITVPARACSTVTYVCTGHGTDLIKEFGHSKAVFIYCDPPYLLSTRPSGKKLYKYEFSGCDHVQLLSTVLDVKGYCMISHPECDLYDTWLHGWKKVVKPVSYRGNVVQECLYMNYDVSDMSLLQYTHFGKDCWDRQRVKRKLSRWVSRLKALPRHEREYILQELRKG